MLLPGCEISSRDGHILAYNIHKEIKKGLFAQETIDEIHAQKGIAVAAHPFNLNSLGAKIFNLKLDALEGFNASTTSRAMVKSYRAAEFLQIPNMASSDAHQTEEIGRSLMLFPESVSNTDQLIMSIRLGNFKVDFNKTNPIAVILRHICKNTDLSVGNLYQKFKSSKPAYTTLPLPK